MEGAERKGSLLPKIFKRKMIFVDNRLTTFAKYQTVHSLYRPQYTVKQ